MRDITQLSPPQLSIYLFNLFKLPLSLSLSLSVSLSVRLFSFVSLRLGPPWGKTTRTSCNSVFFFNVLASSFSNQPLSLHTELLVWWIPFPGAKKTRQHLQSRLRQRWKPTSHKEKCFILVTKPWPQTETPREAWVEAGVHVNCVTSESDTPQRRLTFNEFILQWRNPGFLISCSVPTTAKVPCLAMCHHDGSVLFNSSRKILHNWKEINWI